MALEALIITVAQLQSKQVYDSENKKVIYAYIFPFISQYYPLNPQYSDKNHKSLKKVSNIGKFNLSFQMYPFHNTTKHFIFVF